MPDHSFKTRAPAPFYEPVALDSWADSKRFYASKEWKACRAAYLADHPTCEVCGTSPKVRHVHHRYGWRVSPFDHLATCCHSCHQVITLVARRRGNMSLAHITKAYWLGIEQIEGRALECTVGAAAPSTATNSAERAPADADVPNTGPTMKHCKRKSS